MTAVVLGLALFAGILAAADPVPPGPASARVPWTTSRVSGSPQAPLPYRVERVFPKLAFNGPVDLATAPGSSRFFVVELGGKILSFPIDPDAAAADLFLDLRANIPGVDQAYGIAFHPRHASNHFVYVAYVLRPGLPDGSRVSRFTVNPGDPPRADPASEKILITWPSGGHNGECIQFGPDGCLYISTGDGAGPDPPDRLDTGQDIGDLLASVLRIDVDHADPGKGYRVPPDNPFLRTPGARPEVWAYGLRNPFKMSFDPGTGELWVGDVGYEKWELIHRVRAGGNYGWSVVEGRQSIKPGPVRGPSPVTPPVVDHPHSEATCIIGGRFYTGGRLPALTGAYVYGDYASARLWALRHDGQRVAGPQWIANAGFNVISFAADPAGELYILNYGGTLHRLVPNTETAPPDTFPRRLSETGLWASTPDLGPAPGVVAYSIRAEPWADHATARRWVGLPGDARIDNTNQWVFPKDTVLAKTLSLEMEWGRASSLRRLETQLLHYDRGLWRGYTYRWNPGQTDATLVPDEGADEVLEVTDPRAPGGRSRQTWHYPSRSECVRCHNPYAGALLGFNPRQLETESAPPTLRALFARSPDAAAGRFPDPRDPALDIATRARAYLHLNCAHCHREHSGGAVAARMSMDLTLAETRMVDAVPSQGTFSIPDARVIAPGDPGRSTLFYRISKTGPGHMPQIGTALVDVPGVNLVHDWIRTLSPGSGGVAADGERAAHEECLRRLGESAVGTPATIGPPVERLMSSPRGALALVDAMNRGRIPAPVWEAILRKANTETNAMVRDLFERFLPEGQRAVTLGARIKPDEILGLRGDPDQGRNVFFGEAGPQCFRCHQVLGQGTAFGPDLSLVGRKYDRAGLLDQILYPSKIIAPGFGGYQLETVDESSYAGILVRHDATGVVLRDATGHDTAIAAARIRSLSPHAASLMPEQLLQGMSSQHAADLVDYLATLR